MRLSPSISHVLEYIQQNAEDGVADVRQSDIMLGTQISYGSLYTALHFLEKNGFIVVVRDVTDRRQVSYHLKNCPFFGRRK